MSTLVPLPMAEHSTRPEPCQPVPGRDAPTRLVDRFGAQVLAGGYTSCPNLLLAHYRKLGLSEQELVFVLQLLTYWWRAGLPHPALGTIAARMGKSIRQVHIYSEQLRRRGLLLVISRHGVHGGQLTNQYDLSPLLRALENLAGPAWEREHPCSPGERAATNPEGAERGVMGNAPTPLQGTAGQEDVPQKDHDLDSLPPTPMLGARRNLRLRSHDRDTATAVAGRGRTAVRPYTDAAFSPPRHRIDGALPEAQRHRIQPQVTRHLTGQARHAGAVPPSGHHYTPVPGEASVFSIPSAPLCFRRDASTGRPGRSHADEGTQDACAPRPDGHILPENDRLLATIGESLGDAAPRSSAVRAARLYRRSGLSPQAFARRLAEARACTLAEAGQIARRGSDGRPNAMPYFFAVLEGRLAAPQSSGSRARRPRRIIAAPAPLPPLPPIPAETPPIWRDLLAELRAMLPPALFQERLLPTRVRAQRGDELVIEARDEAEARWLARMLQRPLADARAGLGLTDLRISFAAPELPVTGP